MFIHADPENTRRLMIYEQWLSKTDFDVSGAGRSFSGFGRTAPRMAEEVE